ncbi:MAG: hypothetical protein J5527_07975 [Treponema sp.]|nr:hypothetical protein [Treponema sp.]
MKSDLIRSVFLDELERNKRLLARYEKEVHELPKGSLFKRRIGNQEYWYLNYREGTKVISKFIGNVEKLEIFELQKKLSHRKELLKIIKRLKVEQKELEGELR